MTSLQIALVGHTNTGKTSLMRTLLRNRRFGEIADRAGTTRHVEAATIALDDEQFVELVDTPGLEDSDALYQALQQRQRDNTSGRQTLNEFLAEANLHPEFEQECKVLKQVLVSDLLLYVIDCREAVLSKYIYEIQCLQMAACPLLPVLNFIHADPATKQAWQNRLADLGLHALVAFDTVAFDFAAEKRLYQKLQTLLEPHYALLEALLAQRANQWHSLQQTAFTRVAHLLVAAASLTAPKHQPEQLQAHARELEHACLQDLLALMDFAADDVALAQLPVTNGQWALDLFAKETLKTLSVDTASAAATGAAIGVGIDLVVAGMSLGAASATGAALGAMWHNGKRFGKNLWRRARGETWLALDDLTLEVLLLRQMWLLKALFQRGHAAVQPTHVASRPELNMPKDWPKWRTRLRAAANGWGENPEQWVAGFRTWLQHAVQPKL